jgi:glyoxylase-like metal-dependent hydrolase (beta-lactamase superfamily II)
VTAAAITRHAGPGGARIYCVPVQAFPGLVANVYVVIDDGYAALIDTGSGIGPSDAQLEAGLAALRADWGEALDWDSLTRVIITHAHVDHYGGLGLVRQRTGAPVAVHELDRRVLVHYPERFILTSRALAAFLRRAGVTGTRYAELMGIYASGKEFFKGCDVATTLRHGDLLDGRFRVYHTPGHCPGQVCLGFGDILISADHILARISPHMAPESITPSTGLWHYLTSLDQIAALPGIRLALGGHGEPVEDVYARIGQIKASHRRKLDRVLELCAAPHTIDTITQTIYPHTQGYDTLLAIEEIGAHVEYLDQQGALEIANLDQIAADEHMAPRYQRLAG